MVRSFMVYFCGEAGMLENVIIWTIDGVDYFEFTGKEIVIHRLETADAKVEAKKKM
jgi:hypothetical protein